MSGVKGKEDAMPMEQERLPVERTGEGNVMVPMTPAELGVIVMALDHKAEHLRELVNKGKEFPENKNIARMTAEFEKEMEQLEALGDRLMGFATRMELEKFWEFFDHI